MLIGKWYEQKEESLAKCFCCNKLILVQFQVPAIKGANSNLSNQLLIGENCALFAVSEQKEVRHFRGKLNREHVRPSIEKCFYCNQKTKVRFLLPRLILIKLKY